ncbi:MAG: hypothetical protein H0U13_16855 [Gemmatimonadaceae bacterium]|nr:hypothetical protein [Gemmatimonadaceae bacterium]
MFRPMKNVHLLLACIPFVILSPIFAATKLPVGANPLAISFPHFPDRLHAVVWRNWDLVPTERIATTVGASEAQISAVASSMGLQPNRPVRPQHQKQIYITVLRRNWHLLPYDQLLNILNMTAEQLDLALREDDFLFLKLGNLKPKCEPLRYAEPDEAAKHGAGEIKAVVEKHFKQALKEPGEERFAFIQRLSSVENSTAAKLQAADAKGLRFIYSYFGMYGDPLLDASMDPYPDGLLARLSEMGVNGVWLHVVLRQLAPGGADFPEFGDGHEVRLANLRKLVERGKRHGIAVYLYINEPRAQPQSFFASRPEMAGVRGGDHIAMCTSDARVRKWMTDALAHVFRETPGLGGVFTITASENLTNCASHANQAECPRCKSRSDAEIIAEVNAAIEAGVHQGNPNAKVLAWDWGWASHGDAPRHIEKLPGNVSLLSVSEWSQPFERGGVKGAVGEYSMSVVGPGPRARRHWELAKQRGLKTVAKVQLNNTWELSAVPYLPVMDLVAEHCTNLAAVDVDDVMLSWSLGGYPSVNLKLAQRILGHKGVEISKVLDEMAAEHYGEKAAPQIRAAWTAFSAAFREFPYSLGLYVAPQQVGPANLLFAEPTGYSSTMAGFPYDDLNGWRGAYTPEVFAEQFQKVSTGWAKGMEHFSNAMGVIDPEHRPLLSEDIHIASAVYAHFASVANQARFVHARNTLAAGDVSQKVILRRTLADEIAMAKQLYTLTKHDSRIGFEASNHYFYTPLDLVEKVINCEHLLWKYEE